MRTNRLSILIGLVIAIALATAVLWSFRKTPPGSSTQAPAQIATTAAGGPPSSITAPAGSNTAATSPVVSAPRLANSTATNPVPRAPQDPDAPAALPPPPPLPSDPTMDLDEVRTTLRDFRSSMGENPVGTNAEITRALLGHNPKQVRLAVPPGSQLNGKGELCDRWGTPYFFHQLSGTHMEIRSAGVDREMWTGDDQLGK